MNKKSCSNPNHPNPRKLLSVCTVYIIGRCIIDTYLGHTIYICVNLFKILSYRHHQHFLLVSLFKKTNTEIFRGTVYFLDQTVWDFVNGVIKN